MDRDELRPSERAAFDALPREQSASRILEERTVRALKERGLLRSRPALIRPWVVATAAAASLALFASGLAVGQWMGARQTVDALAALYPEGPNRAAARVQSTGSAHVAALNALVEALGSAAPQDAARAREVAIATLWAAAAEVIRLAPDDELAAQVLQVLESVPTEGGVAAEEGQRNVVWF
ncbi:MAG: hypothetical protein JSU87_09650 [Gemmatimonadota bacterium]|nr:MAG: hypothetical protein JSU87_09650 [Gemmatimonadota bacterium]